MRVLRRGSHSASPCVAAACHALIAQDGLRNTCTTKLCWEECADGSSIIVGILATVGCDTCVLVQLSTL